MGVYVNRDFKGKMRKLREWIEEGEERMTVLIGRDFNARTEWEGGEWEKKRWRGGGWKEEIEG